MTDLSAVLEKIDEKAAETKRDFAAVSKQINDLKTSLETKLQDNVARLEQLIADNQANLKSELINVETRVQNNIDINIGQVSARIDSLECKVNNVKRPTQFNPEISLIVEGIPFSEGENLREKILTLLGDGLRCDPMPVVVDVERMASRSRKPGIVKVELGSVQEKVAILRLKRSLSDSETYGNVYINSAKTHAERRT